MSTPYTLPPLSDSPLPLREALRRAAPAIELAIVVLILEIGIWEWCGSYEGLFRAVALPAFALVLWRSHRRRQLALASVADKLQLNVREGLLQAWMNTAAVTMILALLVHLLAIALRFDGEGFRLFWQEKGTMGLVSYLATKVGFILVQQVLLQYFLAPCCAELIPQRGAARACAALIFGLVHLPSVVLVGITAVAGYCWLALFARSGRILPLAASHLLLAVLAHSALPERLTLNMRVGAPAVEIAERYRVLHDPQLAQPARKVCSDGYFNACGGTNDDFIRALYHDVLLREQAMADHDVISWRPKLVAHTRTDVAMLFFSSPEFAQLQQAGAAERVAQRVDERLTISLAEQPQHSFQR
jgi:hypothetical protein